MMNDSLPPLPRIYLIDLLRHGFWRSHSQACSQMWKIRRCNSSENSPFSKNLVDVQGCMDVGIRRMPFPSASEIFTR